MRRIIMGVLVSALVVSGAFAGGEQEQVEVPDSFEGMELSIITFTGEFNDQGIVRDFEERTGATVNMQVVPNTDYEAKIRPLLATGQGVPDIFVGEAAYVRQFVEAGYWTDLTQDPFNADTSDMFEYAVEMGTNEDGEVVALTWQTTPGGWFYRRSIAREYFGTDDPEEIAEIFSSWDSVMDAAETLRQESNGEVTFFAGIGETLFRPFYTARTEPWIDEDNNFTVDEEIQNYLQIAKQVRENGYDARLDDWSGPWFDAMNTPPQEASVFVYGFPTWGLQFVLNGQEQSSGDWALAAGPDPFTWGGTWLGIYEGSDNKALAWEFIRMMTQDEEWMQEYAERATEFMSNRTVMNEVREGFSSATLGGQNPYDVFFDQLQYVDAGAIQGFDFQINQILMQVMNEYLGDQLTYDEAIDALGRRVQEAFPRVNVD
jgi:ABC-type glycerol-3-phosphate transport system substrate-binding protein